ncbi:TetR/AcrR family transcriptional regulator C-terminal domain-containing protein [Streptomyces sp. ISL-36]|uniref:TetR/AcrR family transcriptional regulator n=1 Tax=Streptomyces sp. ISL-36 TaxID=2819182 RepID=UPI001BEA8397|nr:TetR/AcrR family transcriptional regulator [Streptomyces sp. ISL-36]MBT2441254.1 TetR/AcrR family transcriptional regulator C-terminal domain-containing protein [Streptomyces sp. ISL-36]
MPRPRSLTQDQLAVAALAVIDRDGLAGLSMRAVAKELGMSTMGLYRYVADRDELEGLVVERVLSSVDPEPPAADAPWRDRIEVMVRRLRDSVSAHPSAVPLTMTHRHRLPGLLRWSESVLGLLAEAGIEGEQRVVALRGLISYVVGAIQLEHLGSLAGQGTVVISELPRERFPYMSEAGRHAREIDADREFFGGLAVYLRGLGA